MRCKYCRERIYECDKCEQEFRLHDEILCTTQRFNSIMYNTYDDIFTSHIHRKCSDTISVSHSEVIE